MTIKLVDLFSGTGAFSYVFEQYDCKCVYANDILDESEQIYNLNHKNKMVKKDINLIELDEIPYHNIITAGFNCQPFSIAGKRQGFKDERSNVIWKLMSIIEYHKPKIFIIENVKNLLTHNQGESFKKIYDILDENYYIKYDILDTANIIPQHRERLYMIGFKHKKHYNHFNFDFDYPETIKPIKYYLQKNIDDKYYYTDRFSVFDTIDKSVVKTINDNVLYQYRRTHIRENKSNVCPTLTANIGTGGHNSPLLRDEYGVRKLSPRECFNLQGFPKKYKLPKICDSKLYKLAGNAVSVPIIDLIANKLVDILT